MPGRNIRKVYAADSFYHIYNRGVNKQDIFLDEQDYSFFLGLFKRYLSSAPAHDKKGRQYSWFRKEIELLTFCLMPNHFHLLVYQHEPEGMTHLLRAVMSSYGMYFNQKHKFLGFH